MQLFPKEFRLATLQTPPPPPGAEKPFLGWAVGGWVGGWVSGGLDETVVRRVWPLWVDPVLGPCPAAQPGPRHRHEPRLWACEVPLRPFLRPNYVAQGQPRFHYSVSEKTETPVH